MDIVRKILVPIDFSGDSANGLNYAVSIAQKTQAEVVALHVVQKDGAYEFLGFLRGAGGRPDAVSAADYYCGSIAAGESVGPLSFHREGH
jgi:nucleotide-binding universal stress UspA family protein